MGKYIQIAIAVIIVVALIYFAVNLFNKSAAPYLAGGKGNEGALVLQDDDEVIVTLDDNVYHKVTCEKLRGPTEKSSYRAVKGVNEACPYCIKGQKDEGGEGE